MLTVLQYYRALINRDDQAPEIEITNADEAFGTFKLIVTASFAVRVRRSSDNNEQDIAFMGNNIDSDSLGAFAGGNDLYVPILYGQKGTYNLTQTTVGNQPKLLTNGLSSGKPSVLFALSPECELVPESAGLAFFRNVEYAVVFVLVKVNGNSPDGANALQTIFTYSTPTNSGSRVALYVTGNQGGYQIGSRRLTSNPFSSLNVSYNPAQWNLVTAIYDFGNRVQTIRVNGVQQGTHTPSWTAGNTDDANSGAATIGRFFTGGFRLNGEIAAKVAFNTRQTITQIETVETYLKNYAGIP